MIRPLASAGVVPALLLLVAAFATLPSAQATHKDPITVCADGCDHTTIDAAAEAASPGDHIVVHDGTYCVDLDPEVASDLEIVAAPGSARPLLDCPDWHVDTHLSINGAENATVEGFEVEWGDPAVEIDAPGVRLVDNVVEGRPAVEITASGARLTDNEIQGTVNVDIPGGGTVGPIRNNTLREPSAIGDPGFGVDGSTSLTGFEGNVVEGFWVGVSLTSPSDLKIRENTFRDNRFAALQLRAGSTGFDDVDVRRNAFRDGQGAAVDIRGETGLDQLSFRFNRIDNNLFGGMHTSLGPGDGSLVDARYNWWGSPAGPAAGDPATGRVDFAPWCVWPTCDVAPPILPGLPGG